MHLFNGSTAIEERAALRDFVKQASDIGFGAIKLTRDDLVAAAVEAGTEAKGYMHVQGQRMSFERSVAAGGGACIVLDSDALVKLQCGGIRGIARAFAIVAAHEVGIERDGRGNCHVRGSRMNRSDAGVPDF